MNHFCLRWPPLPSRWRPLCFPPPCGATDTYDYTGDVQAGSFPCGVTSATFDLYGAEGGTAYDSSYGAAGLGGRATATLAVTPGETIEIRVGGQGGASGGYNGGGANTNGPGGGGGATDIEQGGGALADQLWPVEAVEAEPARGQALSRTAAQGVVWSAAMLRARGLFLGALPLPGLDE